GRFARSMLRIQTKLSAPRASAPLNEAIFTDRALAHEPDAPSVTSGHCCTISVIGQPCAGRWRYCFQCSSTIGSASDVEARWHSSAEAPVGNGSPLHWLTTSVRHAFKY